MRSLIVGAGALGGYFGGCLVRAGRDVTFMVRPRRAEQLARIGLTIISPQGDFTVAARTVLAGDIHETFDLVLVGVKSYSLDQAMDEFAAAVGPNTMILPILNGFGHMDRLTARFGSGRVLGGMSNISAGLDADGRVVQFLPNHDLTFGEVAGGISDRTRNLEAFLKGADINGRASELIMQDMWEKFVQLSTVAGITCLMRASIGTILAVSGGQEIIFRLFGECCAVATAAGFTPRPAFIEFDTTLFTTVNSPLKASMLRDIERGSTTEGAHILGDMVNRARALGIETPILDLARTHVAAYEIARAQAAAASA
ncbi:MAG TPA: 2-dehydropantoate 2-reductase [Bradyrhizobium sp.]